MSREVSKYLSSSGDLSYAHGFATMDDADDRMTLAYNWTDQLARKQPFHSRIKRVYAVGMKGNIAKGFVNLWSEEGPQQDIGAFGKITWVQRGSIHYVAKGKSEQQVQKGIAPPVQEKLYHKDIAQRKWAYYVNQGKEDAEAFVKKMTSFKSTHKLEDDGKDKAGTDYADELGETYTDKLKGLQKGVVDHMVDAVLDEPLYTYLSDWWVSLEGYAPVTETGYFVADSSTASTYRERLSMPFSSTLSIAGFLKHPLLGQFQGKLSGRAWLNNTVDAEMIEQIPFQTVASRGRTDTLLSITQSKDVYVGEFKRFLSTSLALRGVWLFPKLAGVSAEVEEVFGDVSARNWKVGVPFHLENKAGDGKVTVEVQWREQYKEHSIGLSVGVPIGGPLFP